MKLSNKILLGFFGFVFIYLTAAFAEVRLRGTPTVMDDKNSTGETVHIPGVTHLVLDGIDKEINVVGSDRARLEVRSLDGHLLTKLKYKVSGDTLTLSRVQSDGIKTIRITVFIPETSLKGITVNNSVAVLKGLQTGFLRISQNSGTVLMTGTRIGKIEVDLNKSYLDISDAKLDTVSAKIESSTVNIFSPVGLLQGYMKDNAFLRLTEIGEIQLKKDQSSRLTLY
jgi:hypothetical protein